MAACGGVGVVRVYDLPMPSRHRHTIRTCRIGTVDYAETATLQRSLRAAREAGAIEDVLLVLEHEPVITCGPRTQAHEVAYARSTDIPVVAVERGGGATYHGPRQVVMYPIFDLAIADDDVKELVWRLEEAMIVALEAHGVTSERRNGYPGVWVDADLPSARKIASLGLRLTRGVTFHGLAVNVACDLTPFTWFTPCGIPDAVMTSVARELGMEDASPELLDVLVRSVSERIERELLSQFDSDAQNVGVDDLRLVAMRHHVDDPDLALPGEPRHRGATRIDLHAVGAPTA